MRLEAIACDRILQWLDLHAAVQIARNLKNVIFTRRLAKSVVSLTVLTGVCKKYTTKMKKLD